MTTRQIRESSDGGTITITTDPGPYVTQPAPPQLYLHVAERGADPAEMRLTPTEAYELVAALHCALIDLATAPADALAPIVVVDDENAVAVAAVLNSARDELLANSTPVTDSVVAP